VFETCHFIKQLKYLVGLTNSYIMISGRKLYWLPFFFLVVRLRSFWIWHH